MPDNNDAAGIISELENMVKKLGDILKELDILFTKVSYNVFCQLTYQLKGVKIRLSKESLDRKISAMLSGHEAMNEEQ